MPNAPLGVLNITLVAGNDVNVHMENTLPSRRPYVNADVVTIGTKLLVQRRALLGYQLHAGIDLFGRQLKKTGDMATRDDHRMAWAHPIGITSTVRKLIIQRHPMWVSTKQTRIIGISLVFLFFFRLQTSTPFVRPTYFISPYISQGIQRHFDSIFIS